MSEARHQRFEIDIEEIERQLRRTSETSPAPRPDPLAELARIVGQDDPFRGILGEMAKTSTGPQVGEVRGLAGPALADQPGETGAEREPMALDPQSQDGAVPVRREDAFDPVADAYGSADESLVAEDLQPLRPHRSRGRLAALAALVLVTGGAVAGGLYWQKFGTGLRASGTPPLITADKAPAKVAPENPGGIDVPNQNKQIYERGSKDGQSRMVDTREQPVDVREVARNLPASRAPQEPAPTARDQGSMRTAALPSAAGAAIVPRTEAGAPAQPNAVTSALGSPRRVRTVTVRPDGSTYVPPGSLATETAPTLASPASLPPPVPVTTVSIPTRQPGNGAAAAPAVPAAAHPATPAADRDVASATPASSPAPVTVLPPSRPRLATRAPAADAAEARAPTQTASIPAAAPKPTERPAAAAASRGKFSVQVAVRPSEEEARTTYASLQGRFAADLDGKPAQFAKADVGGKTVYRVRVGPMSKEDANALCSRLKTSGGQCFVAGN